MFESPSCTEKLHLPRIVEGEILASVHRLQHFNDTLGVMVEVHDHFANARPAKEPHGKLDRCGSK